MAEGGFEVVTNLPVQAPKTAEGGVRTERGPRGGRGGQEGAPRGGRGGRGGEYRGGRGGARGGADGDKVNKPRSDRPRTAIVTDAEGNQVSEQPRKERQPYRGKDGDHPFDRQSGAGRGIKPQVKKDGHGKGNWGDKPDRVYKQKGGDDEPKEETPVVEEVKEEKQKVPEPEPEYEIIGVSLDDFKKSSTLTHKKEARAVEGIKDAKVEESKVAKVRVMTQTQTTYLKDVLAKKADESTSILGFGSVVDEEDVPTGGDSRGRGGRGRGGRGRGAALQDTGARQGARKQNPKQALKKTEDEFPTL